MSFKLFGVTIKIHFLFTAVVSLLLAVDRYGVVPYSLMSVAIHEAGHLVVMLLCKVKPCRIYLCPCGVIIDSGECYNGIKRILIAAGGPLFNLAPALFISNHSFKTAMLVNGLLNLIPIVCTDGGDIADCLYQLIKSYKLQQCVKMIINVTFIVVIGILGAVVFYKSYNPTLLAAAIYMVIMIVVCRNA